MSVLAAISTPNTEDAPDSAPRRIVAELPAIEIDVVHLERKDAAAVAYLWTKGVPTAAFESTLRDDPSISAIARLDGSNRGGFYKVTWLVDSPLVHCVVETNGAVMEARGTAEEWRLKIWFEDGPDASRFQQCCIEREIPFDVRRLTPMADALSDGRAISPQQREALILAYRNGYFEEPRRVTQTELADRLGITASAFGRRLRRGFSNLVEETLIE